MASDSWRLSYQPRLIKNLTTMDFNMKSFNKFGHRNNNNDNYNDNNDNNNDNDNDDDDDNNNNNIIIMMIIIIMISVFYSANFKQPFSKALK